MQKICNKYVKNYDPKKPSKFITYLDMNNLYGWAMSCRFKWLKNVDGFDQCSISERNPIGYIPKVDLEYSNESHALHINYPLPPEKLAIPYDML